MQRHCLLRSRHKYSCLHRVIARSSCHMSSDRPRCLALCMDKKIAADFVMGQDQGLQRQSQNIGFRSWILGSRCLALGKRGWMTRWLCQPSIAGRSAEDVFDLVLGPEVCQCNIWTDRIHIPNILLRLHEKQLYTIKISTLKKAWVVMVTVC